MSYTEDRFKERSTWLGVLGVLSLFGVNIAPELSECIIQIAVGIGSIVSIFTKD